MIVTNVELSFVSPPVWAKMTRLVQRMFLSYCLRVLSEMLFQKGIVKALARLREAQINAEFAEAFEIARAAEKLKIQLEMQKVSKLEKQF
jgi:hypothetical protein